MYCGKFVNTRRCAEPVVLQVAMRVNQMTIIMISIDILYIIKSKSVYTKTINVWGLNISDC